MADDMRIEFLFESSALEPDALQVVRFTGEEALSSLFRFEIDLVTDQSDLDLAAPLGRAATLTLRQDGGETERKLHGLVSEFEQLGTAKEELFFYRAVLVPRLWQLTLSQQNQIYQDLSYPEIIEEELKGIRDKGPAEHAAIDLTTQDYEFRIDRRPEKYPEREYVVQYEESDLAFISRLMEHEGLFYYFEHDGGRDKLVVVDDNVDLPDVTEELKLELHEASGLAPVDAGGKRMAAVRAFSCRRLQVQSKLILKDYNYRRPDVLLRAETDVDEAGHGLMSLYGEHFEKPKEGEALAKVRAQELACRKVEHRGRSDCFFLSAGHLMELSEHFRGDLDGKYVITSVRHEGAQASAGVAGLGGEAAEGSSYRNDFTAIPSDLPFRPARVTPKPKLYGFINGRVDASGAGTRAEIDGEGRYKLLLPFDLSGAEDGKATRWVRMAQPYAGAQHGMHFPLLKDTEVIVACLGGDPDRPVILGAIPDQLHKSVVTRESQTANRIVTASGIVMEWQDGPALGDEEEADDAIG